MVSIVRVDPPGAVQTPLPPPSGGLTQGSILTGTVTGSTMQGQPVVQTPHATLVLPTAAKVEIGTQVSLKLDTQPTPPTTMQTSAPLGRAGPVDSLIQGRGWGDLDEAMKTLAQTDPARFQQVAHTTLPQPGAKLTAQMLFFLTALKGGNFKAWIGETAGRILDRDRPALSGKLSGDFQIMARMADEPQPGDWRLALIPLWSGEKIEKVHMYYRGGGEESEDGTDDGTRFVLDINLTNIGHVQIDGLVKSEQKKLDLIIRTDDPMPDEWRTDIGEIFIAAQELVGLTGGVAYQAAPGNFIEFPPIEPAGPHPGLFA